MNRGECKNSHLVEDFAWATLYKDQQIEDKFENKIWEGYSVPYRYLKTNILKSRPKRQISNIKIRKKKSKLERCRMFLPLVMLTQEISLCMMI